MKAHSRVHKYLSELGFLYAEKAYKCETIRGLIGGAIQLGRQNTGIEIKALASYKDTPAICSPPEVSTFVKPGRLGRGATFVTDDFAIWSNEEVTPALIDEVVRNFELLRDPKLMIDLLDYLMGVATTCPVLFGHLDIPAFRRMETPARLYSRASYLVAISDYGRALDDIARVPRNLRHESLIRLEKDALEGLGRV